MNKIEFSNSVPLYQQVHDILCKQIDEGMYQQGDQIPSEEKLGDYYKVSRVTVRAALKLLVDEKILMKKHGKGTFVARPVFFESTFARGSFTDSCKLMNVVPSTRIVYAEKIKASAEVAEKLGIEGNSEIICVKRVRKTDDVPAIFEVDFFSLEHAYILQENMEEKPIRKIIKEKSGRDIGRYVDTFDVRFADREQEKWLECPYHTALLGVSQVVYADPETILYYNEQFIRSDIYKYVTKQ